MSCNAITQAVASKFSALTLMVIIIFIHHLILLYDTHSAETFELQ